VRPARDLTATKTTKNTKSETLTKRRIHVRSVMKSDRRRGSTLVMVLIIGTLIGFLALVTASVARSGSRDAFGDKANAENLYRCEAAAEMLRLRLVNQWESTYLMPSGWFTQYVRVGAPGANRAQVPGLTAAVSFPALPGVQAWIPSDGTGIGPTGENWIDVVAATTDAGISAGDQRKAQSVRMRFNFGNNPIFDLAMLTVTTNCMFCHLRVNGDVGSIGFFRPGWGSEGSSGGNSGNDSFIVGQIYVAPKAPPATGANLTADGYTWTDSNGVSQKTLNGMKVLSPGADDVSNDTASLANNLAGTINQNYNGPKLPEDTNGDTVADFPPVDTTTARSGAKGKVGVGLSSTAMTISGTPGGQNAYGAWKVPLGGTYAANLQTPSAVGDLFENDPVDGSETGRVDGNLILIGTYDNPIRLDSDIFVEGDVIIKGYVAGKGGVYAGRNIYIAGDVIYKDTPGSWPLKDDAQAVTSIQTEPNTSELRLAARSNILVGDWTYRNDRDSDGAEDDIVPQRDRQGQAFMTDQFSMNNVRYYEADHSPTGTPSSFVSNELRKRVDPVTGAVTYHNDKDELISSDRVVEMNNGALPQTPSSVTLRYGTYSDRYDSALAPGTVVRTNNGGPTLTGTFQPWMSQTEFRGVLGEGTYENAVARTTNVNDNNATREFELGDSRNGYAGTEFNSTNAPSMGSKNHFEAKLKPDTTYDGRGRVYRTDGRIVDVGPNTWATQVTHVDAFMYANKRIGGTSRYSMTVNGGMAAGEIGVLAVYDYGSGYVDNNVNNYTTTSNSMSFLTSHRTWMGQDQYRTYTSPSDPNTRSDPIKRFILNYDYRLRNGGFGYNLIEGGAGERVLYARGGPDSP
jgi:hypothetical protein